MELKLEWKMECRQSKARTRTSARGRKRRELTEVRRKRSREGGGLIRDRVGVMSGLTQAMLGLEHGRDGQAAGNGRDDQSGAADGTPTNCNSMSLRGLGYVHLQYK